MQILTERRQTWSSDALGNVVEALELVKGVADWDDIKAGLGLEQGLDIWLCPSCDPHDSNHDTVATRNAIRLDNAAGPVTLIQMLHELGHIVDWHLGSGINFWSERGFNGLGWQRTGFLGLWGDWRLDERYRTNSTTSKEEDFADTFAGWVLERQGRSLPAEFYALSVHVERSTRLSVVLNSLAP